MHGTFTRSERAFSWTVNIIMLILCALMLYPILFVLGRSFTSAAEKALHPLRLFPLNPDLSGYQFIFNSGTNIKNSYMTTILRTLIGTTLNICLTAMMWDALDHL